LKTGNSFYFIIYYFILASVNAAKAFLYEPQHFMASSLRRKHFVCFAGGVKTSSV
jgi:hypothetical protein